MVVERLVGLSALVIVLAAHAACAGGSAGPACSTGTDCASGACTADGKCVPTTPANDGAVAETGADAAPEVAVVGCTPNHDFVIDRTELSIAPGLHAKFRATTNATVDTVGTAGADGNRTWDLSAALGGDKDVEIDTVAVAGEWFASTFPTASYVARLSAGADTLGVFASSSASITLLGLASPAAGTTQTSLTYATPPRVLSFPLSVGTAFKDTSNLTGTTSGVATFVTDTYDTKADAKGTLKTPYGAFEVVRVSTILTRYVGGFPTAVHTFAFVAECFGTVATLTSSTNDVTFEFTTAASVQRIAP